MLIVEEDVAADAMGPYLIRLTCFIESVELIQQQTLVLQGLRGWKRQGWASGWKQRSVYHWVRYSCWCK